VPIFDKATGRVVAVIVLLIAIAASLRGYLPGVQRADHPQPPRGGASLVYIVALLSVSVMVIGVALVVRLRDPRRVASSASPMSDRLFDERGRPGWRVLLIVAAMLVVYLLVLWVLPQFFTPRSIEQPQTGRPPATAAPPTGKTPQPPGSQDGGPDRDVLRYLTASAVSLFVMISSAAVVARRRRVIEPSIVVAQPVIDGPPVAAAATTLVRAAESGLAEIADLNREPRQAIIACYAAMERELRHFPGAVPQDFDTPTEVLARAVEHRVLHVDNAAELVNLFEEARFSPHVMTEEHRGRAIDVLQLVLADMRSPV
jgi:hypothetical protein